MLKPYLIIFAIVLTGTIANAQSAFKTNESISSQLKHGTVPGVIYSKIESVKKETTAKSVNMESVGKHTRNNSLTGEVTENKIAEAEPQTDLSVQTKPAVPLASDKPAERSGPVEKVSNSQIPI
jgi:hypothetical protein